MFQIYKAMSDVSRDSLVCHRSGYITNLGYLLDLYGPDFVSRNFGCQQIYLFVFDEKLPRTICDGVVRGRHPCHYTKNGARVKHFYKRRSVGESLRHDFRNIAFETRQYVYNACAVIQRCFRKWYGRGSMKLAKLVLKHNVDLFVDIITCEPLIYPCVISQDFCNRSFVMYNCKTLLNCPYTKSLPVYVDEDPETGQEFVEFREYQVHNAHGTPIYKSPFTGRFFSANNIQYVGNTLWYTIAKSLA
jgi:hypothetical protein